MNKEPLGAAQKDAVKHSETRQLTQTTGTWIALAAFVGGMKEHPLCITPFCVLQTVLLVHMTVNACLSSYEPLYAVDTWVALNAMCCCEAMVACVHDISHFSRVTCCLYAGAVSAGMTHYAGTAKALKEEGIEPAARLRAFPTAVHSRWVSIVILPLR